MLKRWGVVLILALSVLAGALSADPPRLLRAVAFEVAAFEFAPDGAPLLAHTYDAAERLAMCAGSWLPALVGHEGR